MSERKEEATKRRDFRSIKGEPEKAKHIPKKKTNRPHLVLYRYKPEIFEAYLKEGKEGEVMCGSSYWYISKEARKSKNMWRVWGRHHAAHSAIESASTLSKQRYYGEVYEFMIMMEQK